jgi:hypothetical protein
MSNVISLRNGLASESAMPGVTVALKLFWELIFTSRGRFRSSTTGRAGTVFHVDGEEALADIHGRSLARAEDSGRVIEAEDFSRDRSTSSSYNAG